METNKDLILRSIKYLSEFVMALSKQKPIELEEIDAYINEFVVKHLGITIESILEKESDDIIKMTEGDIDCESIKDFADILFIKYSTEKDSLEKQELSERIIKLYQIYQGKSNTYSLEIQSRINKLKDSFDSKLA